MIEEYNLDPEDIEMIKAQPHPMAQFAYARENVLTTEEDYCFHLGYLLSCAVHGIKPSYWHDEKVKRDPKIRDFMKSLKLEIVINEKDFAHAKRIDPTSYQMRIEILARGRVIKGVNTYLKGTWETKNLRNTDEELTEKFVHNVSKVMSNDRALKISEAIFNLEEFGRIGQLVEMLF